MGYWDKVGCRLNMKINPEREQTIPIIIHAIFHTMDDQYHTVQIEATGREDHCRRTGRLQSRKEYHRADFQPTHSM